MICGHRGGAKGVAIDNTVAAMKHAIDNGLEMIEFDVSTHSILRFIYFKKPILIWDHL